ncbi:MAG: hypothetical protein D6790_06290, partial [Caldilineae bacterium]
MFLAALRTYGAYLVDGAGGFVFYAEASSTGNLHLTADQVNGLIGQPPGTPLPSGKTAWQIVLDALNEELGSIPFAYGPWKEGQDPATATITTANFEVVAPADPPAPVFPTPTPPPASQIYLPTVQSARTSWWRPSIGLTWQWQLETPVDTSVDAQVYDIDLFDNDAAVVAGLHGQGRKVICYISAGSWEDWRPDASRFPPEVIGKDYEGWPGEKWLDIRRLDLLGPILRARLDQCRDKGFDGVEPDNIDGYTNDTGFPLTAQDQIAFNTWLAQEAHARGLSIGLKNDGDQATELLAHFDWALTEDCFADEWCDQMKPFIAAGKPVFAAEYTDTGMTLDKFCPQAQ